MTQSPHPVTISSPSENISEPLIDRLARAARRQGRVVWWGPETGAHIVHERLVQRGKRK